MTERKMHPGGGIVLGLTVMIPFWIRVGCASTIRKPCEFTTKVRVTEFANGECTKAGVVFNDSGKVIVGNEILGCSNGDSIITNGTESNLGHEMNHQVLRRCRKNK